jgi:predicted DNA-binding helix-hairpin-helix protein
VIRKGGESTLSCKIDCLCQELTSEQMFAILCAMNIRSTPDTLTKLTQMGDVTLFEPAGDQPSTEQAGKRDQSPHYQSHSLAECITQIATPFGKKPILKTMLTTACERNCNYCPFRAGRSKTERISVTPDEMARGFDTLQQAKQVDGLFLSSGIIKGSVTTQDRLLDTAQLIRKRYGYRGYIHLKIMPGVEYDQLHRAMQLASRVSVNLEGPTPSRLNSLAPKKDFEGELLKMLLWAEQIRQKHPEQKLASTVTQFVVGAVGDTDLELLSLSDKLYQQARLTRVYYSGFHPVVQTPFENLPHTDPLRQYRLYQSSFLLRDYGWSVEDLPFEGVGNLRIDVDPKRAWSDLHLRHAPIELMTADREQLLRVPGIGPVAADAILGARRMAVLTDLSQLRKLGIRAPEQAADYILLNGRRPSTQLALF